MNPYTPDDWKALIPNPSGSQCDEFKKVLLQFPEQFYLWYKWAYNSDGSVSTENATAICTALTAIGCTSGGGTSTTTTSGTGPTTSTTTPVASAIVWAVTADAGGGLTPNKFMTINLATGTPVVISTSNSFTYCMGEDPTSGIIYAYVLNGSDIDFVSIDKTTGAETVIGASVTLSASPNGMAFSAAGVCYITIKESNGSPGCAGGGSVYTVNLASGAVTSIGAHALWDISELIFIGSTLYGIGQDSCFSDKKMCTINLATGVVTTVSTLDPSEVEPNQLQDKLAYVNSIVYKIESSQISQVDPTTGTVINIASFNVSTNGKVQGMAKSQ